MKSAPASSPATLRAGGSVEPTGGYPAGGASSWANWWARSRQPILVRLPRGFVALLIGVFLVVIVLAYWVGESRGYRRKQAELDAAAFQPPIAFNANGRTSATAAGKPPTVVTPGNIPGNTSANAVGNTAKSVPPAPTAHGKDARVKGLNYFIVNCVGNNPEAYARRLVEFLWQEGVEAEAVKPDNSRLFLVVALKGFAREELDSPARKQYEALLHRLGKIWKAQHPDAVDLSGMYPARYSGNETVAMVITRESKP